MYIFSSFTAKLVQILYLYINLKCLASFTKCTCSSLVVFFCTVLQFFALVFCFGDQVLSPGSSLATDFLGVVTLWRVAKRTFFQPCMRKKMLHAFGASSGQTAEVTPIQSRPRPPFNNYSNGRSLWPISAAYGAAATTVSTVATVIFAFFCNKWRPLSWVECLSGSHATLQPWRRKGVNLQVSGFDTIFQRWTGFFFFFICSASLH